MTKRTRYPSAEADQFVVRFTDGLRDRIKESAKMSARSMNSEIILRLEASFEAPRQLSPAIAELLNKYIEQEVAARLQAIAANIGGSS